ncbi:putative C6 transcription factor QutA [Aspergillus clavatus NRRL 1]|uniref:C6 transcription factor QutA, putative n=1 Tax=Aspergillus clavatus (strain ATCC 1007 / CBS 513.65 / DSM 816 / NCTC 3887 / NRRL 1 / QM 1276 / 107) TaxID=344612 RepID=A1CPW6_ASPCL|nr:C6 transcription factor QutA, putative [Aspergillus clavatus NRRL 1]EAW07687.1 C6 transcription factor QutA, putative [Aspergillus clavatus NRRL 1]
MSNDTRQPSGAHSRAKRRLTNADEDGRHMAADDSTAQTKRQRVSRACDSCRSKKDKCDGVQPVCSTCASLCRPCTYKTNPKKRGLPTGYIRTLELLYGLIFCKIHGSEEVVRTLLKTSNMPSHLATMGKETEGSDTLVSSWKNSSVLKEIERMLTLLDQPEEEQDKIDRAVEENGSPREAEGSRVHTVDTLEWQLPEGLTDGQEESIATGVSPVKTPSMTRAARSLPIRATKDSSTQTLLLSATAPASASDQQSQLAPANPLPLPSNVWMLLDIYFSYTQCWFPILEKHDILRTAFRQFEDRVQISPLVAGSGDYAALWAVLTLASMQEASLHVPRQNPEHATGRPNASHFYATAKGLMPSENGIHEIGHVQALLILSLVNLGQQKWTAAWLLVGQAIRIARCLGLDSTNQTDGVKDGKSSARSKHVFLGCFVLETLIATKTGQAPSLRKEDLAEIAPVNEDGLEEWHPWEDQTGLRPPGSARGSSHRGPLHALSTFNRLVSLMCILNEICCMRQSQATPTAQLETLERQLQHWISAVPGSYRADLQNPTKIAPPHIFGLEMMYESTVATLSTVQDRGRPMPESPYWIRATESLKILLLLLQKYMETYSLAATSPIFGLFLTIGISALGERHNVPVPFEPELGLKSKLEAFSAHLSTVWSQGQTTEPALTNTSISAATAARLSNVSRNNTLSESRANIPDSLSHHALHTLDSDAQRMSGLDETRTIYSTPNSFLTNTWMGTGPSLDNVALSLPTPTPSLSLPRGAPAPSPQVTSIPTSSQRARLSVPSAQNLLHGRGTNLDLSSPFSANTPPYPPTFNDPNINLGSFVGPGPPRRPRIAPDLDALFDELASLDGTEKRVLPPLCGDHQPEFMQNLGFIPDAGISELYSYSSQMEPFLLAQTQQLPEAATVIRSESHRTNKGNAYER